MRTAIFLCILGLFALTASAQVALSPATKEVGVGEITYAVLIDTGEEWTASLDVSWASISPPSGRGQSLVKVSVSRNTTGALREAIITVGISTHRLSQKSASATGRELFSVGSNDRGQLGVLTHPHTRPSSVHRDIVSVAASVYHTMFVKTDGTLWAVGSNDSGQLGNGTKTARSEPVQIADGVTSVATGLNHTVFRKEDGTLWTMGSNSVGQLGDGTTISSSRPLQVATGVASVTAGENHTMFVKIDGTLWGMGYNSPGQLGDGSLSSRLVPVQTATGVSMVVAGRNHTMFVKTDGTLWATGDNGSGQLGDGTSTYRSVPVQVATGVASVSAGAYHTIFVKTNGEIWATGYNFYGQLGDGSKTNRLVPAQTGTGVASVAAGGHQTMLVKTDGTLWATGNNLAGQLGDGTTISRSVPVQIATGVVSVSAGFGHTMFIRADATLWGTGDNVLGQLGDGTITASTRSVPEQSASGVVSVVAGYQHTMFLKTDNTLWAMGSNGTGRLGDGSTITRFLPIPVASEVASVAAGYTHSVFVKTNGTLWAMGDNFFSQLGYSPTGGTQPAPVQIATGVASVAAGHGHTMFLKTDGTLWATGRNIFGELGDGTTTRRSVPVQVATGVTSVTAGAQFTMFIKSGGALWGVGLNDQGQLGDGTTNIPSVPVQIATEVASVTAGRNHTMFVKTNGTLWAMGNNDYGKLGYGTALSYTVPVQIATGVVSVAPGGNHTTFLKADGTVWAMGENAYGQLGDGTKTNRSVPVEIASGVSAIAAGGSHTSLLLGPDGRLGGPPPTAPIVANQPVARVVALGQTATFTVVASGTAPLAYQWLRANVPISLATTSTLTLTNVSVNEVGFYSVRVTNAQGSVESNAVALTLGTLPVITMQPVTLSVTAGQTATFAVSATGSGTLTYEVLRNGTAIGTSNSGQFFIVNAQAADAGDYSVRVSNEVGFTTSSSATLTVIESPPVITASPSTRAGVVGQATTFSAGYFGSGPVIYQWSRDGVAIVGATGATYSIVDSKESDAGVYTVRITNSFGSTTSAAATLTFANPPPNDNLASAELIAGASAAANGTTVGATGENGEPNHFGAGSQASSIWYRWTAPTTGTATFDTAGSSIDTVLALYTGAAVNALTPIGSDDDGLSGSAGGSLLVVSVNAGTTYSIAVAGYSSAKRGAIIVRVAMTGVPVITSSALAGGTYGAPYTGYTISATDGPISYGATGLPSGLSVNSATGSLTGSPTQAGDFVVTLSATNASGTGTRRVALRVAKANATVTFGNLIATYDGAPKFASATTSPAGLTVSLHYEGQTTAPSTVGGYTVTALIDDAYYQGSATAQLLIMPNVALPAHTYTTFVGFVGVTGSADGSGTAARFDSPKGLALDVEGNLYVADRGNHVVRKITPSGLVTTLAGLAGQSGSTNGTGAAARFNRPAGVCVDPDGNVFVADMDNYCIRRITPSGVVTTFAGSPGVAGSLDGTGSAALFYLPSALVLASSGELFVADAGIANIRRITPAGVVTTYAGRVGASGATDGERTAALFNGPSGLAIDRVGNLFVSENGNRVVRRITPGGVVSTLAGLAGESGSADGTGANARFFQPGGLAIDPSGTLFVADLEDHTIRAITPAGVVTTLAGLAGQGGSTDGQGSAARFRAPSGLALAPDGKLYVADAGNHTIRLATLNGAGAAPVISGAPLVSGVFGQPLENYLIRATGYPTSYSANGLPVGLICNPSTGVISGTPAAAGIFPVTFTATNASGSGSASLNVVIGKAPALITVGNLNAGFTGAVQHVSATTIPPNLPVGFTYNGSTSAPAAAGIYAVVATINDANYQGSAQATFIINPANPLITLTGLSPVYDGTPRIVSATTNPMGLPVKIVYDGVATPPILPGAYTVRATVDDPSYQGSATATLVVSKAPAIVVLNNLTVTFNGSPRPVTVTTTPAGLAVSVTYAGTNVVPTDAGTYAVTATINDGLYAGSLNGTLIINKALSTVTLGGLTTVYTGSSQTPSATTNPTGLAVRFTFSGSSTPPINAGTYAVTGTIDERNYVGSVTGTFVINKAAPPLTWPVLGPITYGTALSSTQLNASAGGVAGTFGYSAGAGTVLTAGSNQTLSVTFTPVDSGNYVVVATQRSLTVNPATLTVTADDKSRPYAAANPAFTVTYSGFVQGQNASALTTQATAASGAVTTSNAGNYSIVPSGAASPNYSFTYVNGSLTVNKLPLTITADNKFRTYGAANPAFTVTYAGFVNGESPAVLTNPPTATSVATQLSNVGPFAITPGGASATNYSFIYTAGVLSIAPARLIVTADDKVRTYGAANPPFTVSYAGFVNGESPTVLTTPATAVSIATALSNVGTYPITPTGGSAANYSLSHTAGVLTVNQALLTVTAEAKTRIYGAPNPAFTLTYDGFVNGETASALTVIPTAASTASVLTDAGRHLIIPSGGAANNYGFAYVDGVLMITQAPLTATAISVSRTYGATDPSFAVSFAGFVNSQTASVLTAQPTIATTATVLSNVGTYALKPGGAAAVNYNLTNIDGVLSITPAPLVVTADDKVRMFGLANPVFTVRYEGFVNGENAAVLISPSSATTVANASSVVGTYSITASGGNATNYVLSYSPGLLTITTAAAAGHTTAGLGYVGGLTVRIYNRLTYTGALTTLKWQTLLPTGLGWSYVAGAGTEGQVKPESGATELLEWEWTTIPASPVEFSYTLRVPAGTTAAQVLTGVALMKQAGIDSQVLAQPEPLAVTPALPHHHADSNQDFQLNLFELTRVIELYNVRRGSTRTGAYGVASGDSEDGFASDDTRGGAAVTLPVHHSADTNFSGSIGLVELTRVIELFNTRQGTTRTGAYRVLAGTEDGFAPGP